MFLISTNQSHQHTEGDDKDDDFVVEAAWKMNKGHVYIFCLLNIIVE